MKHFASFCSAYNVCDPFPVSELTLCYYSSYLAKKELAPQTIKSYLAALRNAQISMGLPDPRDQSSLPLLKRVQAGISRIRLQSGKTGARVRLPITTHIMAGLRNAWQGSTREDKDLLWAVTCTAFLGFFRLGELLPSSTSTWMEETDFAWGDVAGDSLASPSMVQMHLKKSKTGTYGQGADVVMGVTNTAICPVKAMCQFLQVRGVAAGPFFVLKNGSALTKPAFIEIVRTALQAMGLPTAPVCRAQLPDWGSNHSSARWPGGLTDSDSRKMAQYSILELRKNSEVTPRQGISIARAATRDVVGYLLTLTYMGGWD